MFGDDSPFMRAVYLFTAATAGAITALSVRPFKGLTRVEIIAALFVGTTAAVFLGPVVVQAILGREADLRLQAAIFYIIATGNNAFIPAAVKWTLRLSPFGKGDDK